MTLYTIQLIVGFVIAMKDYINSLGKEYYNVNVVTSKEVEEYKNKFPDEEFPYIDKEMDFISELIYNNKNKLFVSDNYTSDILSINELSHDVEREAELLGLAIGIKIGQKDCKNWPMETEKSKNIYSLDLILEARDKINAEMETIKIHNPNLYELFKSKKYQIIMVQDGCVCCS